MLKQAFICFFSILLIFTLTGCGQEEQVQDNEQPDEQQEIIDSDLSNKEKKIQEISKNFEKEKVAVNKLKQIIASSTNPTDCEEIESEYYYNACINQVVINKVIETEDKSYCDQIQNEIIKNDCMMIQFDVEPHVEDPEN
jgi:predicted small lipoprotein YifL